jgi:hypothetical protein
MRCYYHHDKEAVALCKSCAKALCAECAVDIGKGVACKDRCEEDAKAVTRLIERNIQLLGGPQVQLVPPNRVPQNIRASEQAAVRLTTHIKQTRHFQMGSGIFFCLTGLFLIVFGAAHETLPLELFGVWCIGFGGFCIFRARGRTGGPTTAQTQTK